MSKQKADVIVAGHICLDIIPTIRHQPSDMNKLFAPGKLVDVGAALTATGGAVSNTGIALHRLGASVRLMGKVGKDQFGRAILNLLQESGSGLSDGMIVTEGENSSYTVVISPPGFDRVFLHHTGTNDTFESKDVNSEKLEGVRLFHFGYPPLMRKMYTNDGTELEVLLRRVKSFGITTSLDLAKPDPDSDAGQADWTGILQRILPHTDLFLPSFEEVLYMLDPAEFEKLEDQYGSRMLSAIDGATLSSLADRLIGLGAAVVAIKLGEHGLYMRTTARQERIQAMGACAPSSSAWLGRELLIPCYYVQVVGTTGAGDCTIAGFLTAILKGLGPQQALHSAVAVGACNVEQADATSGVPKWEAVEKRLAQGWRQREQLLELTDWQYDVQLGLWRGPEDRNGL